MARGHSEQLVELSPHRAYRTVGHNGEARVHVHAGEVGRLGAAFLVHALVEEAHATHRPALDEGLGHRGPGPDLDRAGGHDLASHPLHELAYGEDEAVLLVEEGRGEGQLDGVVLHLQQRAEGAQGPVGGPQRAGATAGADGIEQVEDFSSFTGVAIGICVGSRSGKAALMARPRVTTPETPNPTSSARS